MFKYCSTSGQSEYNLARKEWQDVKLKKDEASKHSLLFITDRMNDGELKVEYCPSSDMIADFFTKPLQGKLFYKFRQLVMNHK